MNRVIVVVSVFHGTYGIEGKGSRPCGFAEVRRIVNRENDSKRVTRARLVDSGSSAQFTAEQVARGWAMSHYRTHGELVPVETRHINIGHVGTFPDSDDGRETYLSRLRSFMRKTPSGAHGDTLTSAEITEAA